MSPNESRATNPYRLALLDDHGLIVDSLARWFEDRAPDFEVVLRATSWMELIRSPQFPVDLVLMDLQLGDTVSIESRIRACRAAGAKVLVVTALDDDKSRDRSLAAGAAGFVSKTLPADELVEMARRAARGERLPRHPSRAAGSHHGHPADTATQPVEVHDGVHLSPAEERALRYYVQGLSTVEVSRRMDVGYETAKTYLRRVREKYAKADRPASRKSELIRRAAEDGYLE
ncbi:response regulator transcription factor [Agromyces sp. ISL-38]|uniref:response regulator transcription factor n=1 Tax=Agromyces sp. ISL-38 TaxID=2819107 RepID=UPI001BECDCAC|nr:response regulator transcription factor [Agromyces sp. ISL-38]MBT2499001.1 response regulator transcription factor [Agromyces sp. ISL-38]MBT2518454.1 response regulator transcription factor [Streptomyces sp. ISL-90]